MTAIEDTQLYEELITGGLSDKAALALLGELESGEPIDSIDGGSP